MELHLGQRGRILDFVCFMLSATLRCMFLPRPGVVVATSPQFFAALSGRWVSLLKRRPFVFELRDLWPESVTAVGAVRNSKLLRPFESMARRLY